MSVLVHQEVTAAIQIVKAVTPVQEEIMFLDGGTANGANGPCADGFPKVDVRATDIEGLSFAPIWHLFVIFADCSGTEYFYRGGPSEEGGGGTIVGTSGEYKSGTVDWDPEAPFVTVAKGSSASGKGDC